MSKSGRRVPTLLGLNGKSSSKTRNTMPSAGNSEPPLDHEYRNPAERYNQLPKGTREFLEQLREEDIDRLKAAMQLYTQIAVFGTGIKWIFITLLGALLFGAQFGEAVMKYVNWIRGK